MFGFTKDDTALWPQDWYDGVKEIAAKAPKLTFVKGERAEIRQLNVNHAISKEGVTYAELQEMKNAFLLLLVSLNLQFLHDFCSIRYNYHEFHLVFNLCSFLCLLRLLDRLKSFPQILHLNDGFSSE